MKKISPLLLITVLMISSCKKSDDSNSAIKYGSSGMFVVNEGRYTGGNSSISYFRNESNYSNLDIYKAINNSPLGDVAQSMNIFNGFGYIVVNNSKKVEIVNMTDFHLAATISGLESPRYFLGINNTKGYISDWTADNIKVLNLTTNTISSTIPCGAGPEQMLLTSNKVFVCNVGGFGNDSTITVIDANSNSVLSTIQVGINPNSIQQDVNGKLWVLCGGTIGPDYTPSTSDDIGGALIQIDPSTNAILKRFDFTSSQHPTKLAINGAKDKIYYLNGTSGITGKIFNLGITGTYLHNQPLVDREFYGLGVDPQNGYVYGGIGNFSLSTYIIKYLSNGTLMDSSKVGVAPSSFVFNY